MTVDVMFAVNDEVEILSITVPQLSISGELTMGTPVGLDGSGRPPLGERVQRPEAPRHRLPRGRGDVAGVRCGEAEGGLTVTGLTVALALLVSVALVLRWRRPAWYWLTFGVVFALVRVLARFGSVMEACSSPPPLPGSGSPWPAGASSPCPASASPGSCGSSRLGPASHCGSRCFRGRTPSSTRPPQTGCGIPSPLTRSPPGRSKPGSSNWS